MPRAADHVPLLQLIQIATEVAPNTDAQKPALQRMQDDKDVAGLVDDQDPELH